jgi:two-component system sensor histidine kinase ResE
METEKILKEKLDQEILFNQIVAHDLRNILCNMTMLVGFLHRSVKGQEQPEKIVNQIRDSAFRMDRIISQLLEHGKIKAGKIKPHKTVFSASDLKNFVELFEENSKAKGVTLKFDCPERIMLFADKDMICQVLDNLISNALKFTNSGGEVQVYCASGNPHARIHVKDTGDGIAPEDTPHLFDTYWQKKKRAGSLGIGLSICKSFVEENDGDISVSSKLGEGTTFTFTVPTVHQ